MSEHRPQYDISQIVPDRRHRMTEQFGEPSQPTPIPTSDDEWLRRDVDTTMRSLMESMRTVNGDPLSNQADNLHALADALNAVNMVRCTLVADEFDTSHEMKADTE